MKQNTRTLLPLIAFVIVAAESDGLLAQLDDSQNLEQIIQKVNRLDRWNKIFDPIISTILGTLVILFIRRVWGYGKKIETLTRKLEELRVEVAELKRIVDIIDRDVMTLWIIVGLLGIAVIFCIIDLIMRHV